MCRLWHVVLVVWIVAIRPGILGTSTLSDYGPVHPCSSRSNIVTEVGMPATVKEEDNLHILKEQLQLMVKSHLKRL